MTKNGVMLSHPSCVISSQQHLLVCKGNLHIIVVGLLLRFHIFQQRFSQNEKYFESLGVERSFGHYHDTSLKYAWPPMRLKLLASSLVVHNQTLIRRFFLEGECMITGLAIFLIYYVCMHCLHTLCAVNSGL